MISIKVNGVAYSQFNSFVINLRFDAIASSFSFTGLFDPNNAEHKDLFKPLSFPVIEIFFKGEKIITGYIANNSFSRQRDSKLTSFAGYSKTGILEDCNLPEESYPLQFENLTLKQIAEKVCLPFGINVIVDDEGDSVPSNQEDGFFEGAISDLVESVIPTDAVKETQTGKDYLANLCNQRNIVLTHNENGDVVLTKAKANAVAVQRYNDRVLSAVLSTNGQDMYSDTLVMKQASLDTDNAGQSTVKNPYITLKRTATVTQTSGDDNETEAFAKNVLTKQLKKINLQINTEKITFDNGDLIKPNKIITYQGPENYIYNETKFFIESVTLKSSFNKDSGTLNCVIPEVYTKQEPKNIFG